MQPVTASDIEQLFTKKQLQKCPLIDLSEVNWEDLEFLAWFDKHDQLAMVVCWREEELVGLALQKTKTTTTRPTAYMCSWCSSPQTRSGIATFCYSGKTKDRLICHMLCADLGCSWYIRGLKRPSGVLYGDMAPVERKIERVRSNMMKFVEQVEGV